MYFEASLAEKARKFLRLVLKRYAFPPNDITIEVSTNCGQGCAVCFRGPLEVSPADMSYALFSKVLSEIKAAYGEGRPRYLNFVGLGEPFCNPELGAMLRLAAKTFPGTGLNLSTSLSSFDRAGFAALVRDGIVNRLSVSLDGLEPGASFHPFTAEVRGNFDYLKELKKSLPGFKVRVQTLITSRAGAEEAVTLAADAGAEEIQLMRVDLHAFKKGPPVSRPPLAEERAIVKAAAGLAAARGLRCRNNNAYDIFMDLASAFDRYCLTADDHIFISAEGDVLPCFYLREVKFGSLASQSLAEIAAARDKSDFYGSQKLFCAGCDIYKRDHAGGGGA
ncbi:MAG: SPASM domain-containing protein [Elusimicrobia bacterium]|nr:SPASM domain-containing protein [Elusimicrobiota bacterium]